MLARHAEGLARLFLIASLFCGLALLNGAMSGAAQDDAESVVAGRLGGTLGSFIERYGEPASVNAAVGPIFAIDGFGYVAVRVTDNRPENPIRRITVSSERSLELPASDSDPADWTLDEAVDRVLTMLPTDVELSEFTPDDNGQLSAVCHSDALAEIDPSSEGQCRIAYVQPSPETVSYASLTLIPGSESGEALTPVASRCTGALEWIAAAGAMLTGIQALLEQVSAIDENDPDAVSSLREIAESFRQLAADQRGSDPPGPAGQASFYLISALTTYAKAVEQAADGVESGDSELVNEAVAGFEDAQRAIAHVTVEIERAGKECGLSLGTPVPSASPSAATGLGVRG